MRFILILCLLTGTQVSSLWEITGAPGWSEQSKGGPKRCNQEVRVLNTRVSSQGCGCEWETKWSPLASSIYNSIWVLCGLGCRTADPSSPQELARKPTCKNFPHPQVSFVEPRVFQDSGVYSVQVTVAKHFHNHFNSARWII